MPRVNPFQVALAFVVFVIVVVVISIFVSGCSSVDSDKPKEVTKTPYVQPEADMELVGCVDGTCTYTFYRTRRCFLTIGQSTLPMHADTWMFDLECPG